MDPQHIVIVGGGLAGLSAGCYARASGFRTTIVEHNIALGGVCTAWRRGPYLVDGCIHWLTGGPFMRIYDELGITQRAELRVLRELVRLRDAGDGTELALTADLDELGRAMRALGPDDGDEISRFIDGARAMAEMAPPMDKPRDLFTLRDGLRMLWEMRHELGTAVHFRKPLREYAAHHLHSPHLRKALTAFGDDVPTLFVLMMTGYLSRGWLSRPVGGTAAFRDALVASYQELGGETILDATVDEILVDDGAARGVRLHDGTLIDAGAVICTSSTPETVFRLLGGRYQAEATRRRLREWKMFEPIVMASYGVAMPLDDQPQLLSLAGIEPIQVGGVASDRLYVRVCNDDPCFAPPGHSVVQALVQTDYDWWARRGAGYQDAKQDAARDLLAALDRYLPGVADAQRMTDVATPVTYWRTARSWRGAYEGWTPSTQTMFGNVPQRIEGVDDFYLAGQWVEPGGGVPTACSSGREAVQLLCVERETPFVAPHAARARR